MDRREFITTGGIITTAIATSTKKHSCVNDRIKAILFDGFPIFNPTKVFEMAIQLFPKKGTELVKQWKTKQFEYTWLRTINGNYSDFIKVINDALVYAAAANNIQISKEQMEQLVNGWYQLDVWPEVTGVLQQLKDSGYRLGILSNFTPKMLSINSDNHHLSPFFEHLISVDTVQKYKPAPETYHLGMQSFNLNKDEILFVPFAGWDSAGSKQFGYKTFWVNRLQASPEELDVRPDATGKNLNELLLYLK